MKNTIESCLHCPVGCKSFRYLTSGEMDFVNDNRYEALFRPGEILVKQGSPSSNALFLFSGLSKTYVENNGSKNMILGIDKPGELILGQGAFTEMRNNFSVAAITSVKACFIGFDVFRHLIRSNGAFAESLLEEMSMKSQLIQNRMVSLAHKKMPGRIAEALLYLSDSIFGSHSFEMILSRQELGDMTNMAKECVVRILREMEESGVIKSDSSGIRILDSDKLRMILEKG
ncbi:MAG: Crp/Fnr family transcriptional regulator [Bacteroidales bacterium]|nr:Crp/Fnr family transcriptional regulator [Bacteroidales bacterium]